MGVFTDTIHRFAPSWFQKRDGNALKLLHAFGGVLDETAQRVFDGRRAAIPYAGGSKTDAGVLRECDVEVLPWHASDRGIRLYDSEPVLSKRFRLGQWRQLKKRRGSHRGELENIQPFWLATATSTLPTMRVVHQGNESTPEATWYTLTGAGGYTVKRASPSNWNYSDEPLKRGRFWVIIHLPAGFSSSIVYDDGVSVYDGGAIYDGVTTIAIADLTQAIKEAKAAHSRLAGLILTELAPTDVIPGVAGTHYPFDPTDTAQTSADGWTTLPTGNWLNAVDPVTNLPTRPPWASFAFTDHT